MAGDANARSPILSTMKYQNLAITNADDLLFGTAPKPLLTRQGLRLGGGLVYPELNFTLPAMEVTAATRSEEHTSELQSPCNLVCRLLLETKRTRLPTPSTTPSGPWWSMSGRARPAQ